jgi:signal transduction histidine kinase
VLQRGSFARLSWDGPSSRSESRRESGLSEADVQLTRARATVQRRWGVRRLSAKLLLLTILFVMVAEVLIYVPSVANFRNGWLQEKLETAAAATMAAQPSHDAVVPLVTRERLLEVLGVEAIAMRAEGRRILVAAHSAQPAVAARYELNSLDPLASIIGAFTTLLTGGERTILAVGELSDGYSVEVVVSESRLFAAMMIFSRNILVLSLIISIITAGLVYLALTAMIVRPIERLAANMTAFSANPEDKSQIIAPSGRRDEIGVAEDRLASMQQALSEALKERRHLADLGLAVSKINHDLRNMLASAQLFSDRLGDVDDPLVRRIAPKLIGAIDRAIGYTRSVLSYGQAREEPPQRRLISLRRLADDVADVLALSGHDRIEWENRLDPGLEADADPDQLFRVVMNICRNAMEALQGHDDPAVVRRLWAEGEREGTAVRLRICDTGPGVPDMAKARLFQPFHGTVKPGGTGLGLAIASEIVRAHGGEIALLERPGAGAVFQISVPDRPVDLRVQRSARSA